MKFSRYGAPWTSMLNSWRTWGRFTLLTGNRSSAGRSPVALYQASSRAGVCMNMMKLASTVGYLLHRVMPTVCDVAPSLPA